MIDSIARLGINKFIRTGYFRFPARPNIFFIRRRILDRNFTKKSHSLSIEVFHPRPGDGFGWYEAGGIDIVAGWHFSACTRISFNIFL